MYKLKIILFKTMQKLKVKNNKKVTKKVSTKKVFEKDIEAKTRKPSVLVIEEGLPEDVKEALGFKRAPKSKIKEVDYIAELENLEDTEGPSGGSSEFDDAFGGGLE